MIRAFQPKRSPFLFRRIGMAVWLCLFATLGLVFGAVAAEGDGAHRCFLAQGRVGVGDYPNFERSFFSCIEADFFNLSFILPHSSSSAAAPIGRKKCEHFSSPEKKERSAETDHLARAP